MTSDARLDASADRVIEELSLRLLEAHDRLIGTEAEAARLRTARAEARRRARRLRAERKALERRVAAVSAELEELRASDPWRLGSALARKFGRLRRRRRV